MVKIENFLSTTFLSKSKPNRSFWSSEAVRNCKECGLEFGIRNSKHHCRCCGQVVCSGCSSKKVAVIPAREIENSKYVVKRKRVCNGCSNTYAKVRLAGAPCEYLIGGKLEDTTTYKFGIARYENVTGNVYKQGHTGQRRWIRSNESSHCASRDCSLCLQPLSGKVSQFCTKKHAITCHHTMHFSCALSYDAAIGKNKENVKQKSCPCCDSPYDLIKFRENPFSGAMSSSDSDDSSSSSMEITENGVSYFLVDRNRGAVFRIPSGRMLLTRAPGVKL
eukprot:TRINITY_DN1198_c1_g1_i1.p1 TRINITY_DN1198_c1_g1~~TRINITY_DN1198_c1_g1_i1.p1  ORF type:complete len:296 (+),score=29.51 TRINITY_DN1198_c1_g1_i1:59-889(+)